MEQPKRPQTAYWLYFVAHRADIVKELGFAKGPTVAKAAGEKWKNLAEVAKKPFEERAAALKIEYEKAVEAFKAQGGVMTRKPKDSKGPAPKRPAGAGGGYCVYLAEVREEVAKSLRAGHKLTDVSKAVGAKWKALTNEERKPYEEKSAAKRQEYEAALAEWKAWGGAEPEGDAEAREAGGEGEDARPAPEKAAKKREAAAPKGEAPAAKRGRKVATPQGLQLEEKVLQKARELGMEAPLRNLAGRGEVASLGLPGQQVLDALEKSCGLVNKAKAALLAIARGA